jgi:hypothetical protein
MNTAKGDKYTKEKVINQCWDYLNENFHKFKQASKIKIAVELCKKNMPTEITGKDGKDLLAGNICLQIRQVLSTNDTTTH